MTNDAATRDMLRAEMDRLMDEMYRTGGNPEFVYTTLERLHEAGQIGKWEFRWRRLLRSLRLPQPTITLHLGGTSKPSA